jgi:hypothetical protein
MRVPFVIGADHFWAGNFLWYMSSSLKKSKSRGPLGGAAATLGLQVS